MSPHLFRSAAEATAINASPGTRIRISSRPTGWIWIEKFPDGRWGEDWNPDSNLTAENVIKWHAEHLEEYATAYAAGGVWAGEVSRA